MVAKLQTRNDGSIALQLDSEAARAVFASVIFASRFHENIGALVEVAKQGLKQTTQSSEGSPSCQ